ncbi:hypothetical protein OHB41_48175 [Streptomyces sp. NBC_01571]|uniref:hypothetical protein n=1 Tax=Streptomyces sp. NBC_01571 TaxID=2975883 RepID=UPI00224E93EE|nr:hypothetical protein [Streptomyces sp. NBC_01571]MCX4580764.1 hypothetical protein [Streptomyces sp. NBC_01571]
MRTSVTTLLASGAAGGPTAAVAAGHGWGGVVVTAVVTLIAALITRHGKEVVNGVFRWLSPPHMRQLRWLVRKGKLAAPLTAQQLIELTVALHPQDPATADTAAGRPVQEPPSTRRGSSPPRRRRRPGNRATP